MMQLLIPLGLLGLIGILALILIYIIKPNYQTKHVSTTYVWKLSLKYRKKRIPTSTIRNILLFLCQVLALTAMALILAQPAIVHSNATDEYDTIAIIDSSASMYAGTDGETRFDRAMEGARTLSEETMQSGGYASVILADGTPAFLGRRVSSKNRSLLLDEFTAIEEGKITCSYGASDIDAAMLLSEDVLAENPSAKIYLYTDTEYSHIPENVTVVPVTEQDEWNVAILSVKTELVDGYYQIAVEVASYGDAKELGVRLDVTGADADEHSIRGIIRENVLCDDYCTGGSVKTVIFCAGGGVDSNNVFYYDLDSASSSGSESQVRKKFYSYKSLHVSLEMNDTDSFTVDDNYYLYDGRKETVKVLYASTDPNPFFTSALDTLKELFENRWTLEVEEVPKGRDWQAYMAGYDLYIFEHKAPEVLPGDGAVILADPDAAPRDIGLTMRSVVDHLGRMVTCNNKVTHPVTEYLEVGNIAFSRYTVFDFENSFEALFSIDSDPLLLMQNDKSSKIAVMPFSVHYSDIALRPEWLILLYNIFDYFLPATVNKASFEVGEEVVLNARGPRVTYSDTKDPVEEFPASLKFDLPGTYTLRQELYFPGKGPVNVNIYVYAPAEESNLWAVKDRLEDPYKTEVVGEQYDDLLVVFTAILFALVMLEWILHSKEGR